MTKFKELKKTQLKINSLVIKLQRGFLTKKESNKLKKLQQNEEEIIKEISQGSI